VKMTRDIGDDLEILLATWNKVAANPLGFGR
jgi:hypothetical protein